MEDEVLDGLVGELVFDTVHRIHYETQQSAEAECRVCHHSAHKYGDRPGLDIYGNRPDAGTASELVTCMMCHRSIAVGRFAPHLEKCMGMGRQASRQAKLHVSHLAAATGVGTSARRASHENILAVDPAAAPAPSPPPGDGGPQSSSSGSEDEEEPYVETRLPKTRTANAAARGATRKR